MTEKPSNNDRRQGKMDMKKWLQDMREAPVKKALPVLSFPAIQLMGISVRDLIASSDARQRV